MERSWRTPVLVLACGTVILFINFGARNIFGLLLDPMTSALGWTAGEFSFAVALQAFVWGVTTPVLAALADRFGTARMVALGGLMYAAGFACLALVRTPFEMSMTSGLMIGIGLSASGFPIILAAVTKNVDARRRSLFLGIGSAAGSSGQLALVPFGQHLISSYDWVVAVLAFAVITAAIVPLAWALVDPRRAPAAAAPAPQQRLGGAVREAMAHRGFLLLNAGYFVCGFQILFLATHLPNFLLKAGQDAWVGANAIAIIGLLNIVGTFAWGAMGGTYSMKNLLSLIYLLRSAVLVAFILLPVTPVTTYVFAAAIGLLWLATVPLTSGLVARIFGLRYMATLTGLVFFSHQLGSFLGIWLGGRLLTETGSYDAIWWTAIVLGLIAALLHYPINDRPVERAATGSAVQEA